MEEIKVGDYVRNKEGKIIKVGWVGKAIITDENDNITFSKLSGEITKHSSNIIDLIENGDYLDGTKVDSVEKDENGHVFYAQNYDLPSFDLKNIKSIVTKEQFENAEYKLDN